MEKLMKFNREMHESFAKSAAKSIQYFNGDKRNAMLKRLRDEVEKLCTTEERVKQADRIKECITEMYEDDEIAEEERSALIANYEKQISEITPSQSSYADLEEFDRIVQALTNDQDGKNGEEEEGKDNDLQMTQNTVNVIDPITKKRMTDPVKNDICGHVYDRESVAGLISMNAHTRCPFPGCKYKDYLKMCNMRSDIITKTYLLKHPA